MIQETPSDDLNLILFKVSVDFKGFDAFAVFYIFSLWQFIRIN